MAEIELGTLYEMNKEMMKKEPQLDPIQYVKKINEVAEAIKEYNYAMLLCHDRRDYTLFDLTGFKWDTDELKKDLSEVIGNRGTILAIDLQDTGAYEIWIKGIDDECFAYYLFDYSQGVVKVGES